MPAARLAFAGDIGHAGPQLDATGAAIAKLGVADPYDALVLLGDHAYPRGDPKTLARTVFGPVRRGARSGHARCSRCSATTTCSTVTRPRRSTRSGSPRAGGRRTFGDLLLIGLDSNVLDDRLRNTSSSSGRSQPRPARWLVVALHHPPFSAGLPGFGPRDPPRVRSDVCPRRRRTSSSRPMTTTTSAATRSTVSPTSCRAVRPGRGSPVPGRSRLRRTACVTSWRSRCSPTGSSCGRSTSSDACSTSWSSHRATARPCAAPGCRARSLGARDQVPRFEATARAGARRHLRARSGARRALDLFTGTTRVAQEFKRRGRARHRGRHRALRRGVRAAATSRSTRPRVDAARARRARSRDLAARPGVDGYVTETFCVQSRFFQPHNGRRIDAIRDAIERDYRGSWMYPVLLTSLIEAADRVDSTTGVQMAYVKQWAPRSFKPLELRVPELLAGPGAAVRGDACDARRRRSGRSTSRTSTRPTTSTATSRTTTSGRRWSRGTRPSTTASRASASTRAIRRRRACSTTGERMPDALARA